MSDIVFLDTETTGLDELSERVFEIAAIKNGREFVFHLEPEPEVVARMHPKALEVNRYHERTSAPSWRWDVRTDISLRILRELLEGAHIVGAVPDFDARHLKATYDRAWESVPRWHYHLIDVEALAVGYLHGRHSMRRWQLEGEGVKLPAVKQIPLPWESDNLSRACGVEPPSEEERHTALGDARWVKRLYEAITGGAA